MRKTLLLILIYLLAPSTFAQNTGGVFGPVVNDGHRSIENRVSFEPDDDDFAQRLHYEQSFNDDLMWRVVIGTSKTEDSDVDFDSVRGELFWQLSEDGKAYQTGVRFDLVLRDNDKTDSFGMNWMNQFKLDDNWSVRGLLLTSIDFGDQRRDGVFLQTRGQLNRTLQSNRSIGIELYSSYGSTNDFADFEEQNHQIGPYVRVPITNGWTLTGNVLAGITEASPDTTLRIWINRRL